MIKINIEIDCDPYKHGMQEVEARNIFKNILKREYRDADYKLFGCWAWTDVECTEEQQKQIGESLRESYENGTTRYVSWGKAGDLV